jgi:sirohydrochlorin cobaltochelatase
MSVRRGILFAAPGTTCREARGAYGHIERVAGSRFPDTDVRWTYTSSGIRRKLAAQGTPAKDPAEALAAMAAEGFTHVAVASLHLSVGMEFGELAHAVKAFRETAPNAMKAALGSPLLTSEDNWRRAVKALLATLPGEPAEQDRIVLIAHGSREPQAEQPFLAAGRVCRAVDSRVTLGMMLGSPGLAELLQECRSAGTKKAWLLPCMVAAGFSAREEIAGAGEHSWATAFEQAGILPIPVVKGLGEIPGVVDIWMDGIERLFAGLTKADGQ